MLKEILINLFHKKAAIGVEEIFSSPGEAAEITETAASKPASGKLDAVFKRSIRIRQVDAGSCNACEWECIALGSPVYDVSRFGMDFVASPRHADVILVTGPVSLGMAGALKKVWLATPEPKIVIACGNCARDGGIYNGAYGVLDGAASVVPVDGYIPGCPPTPAAIMKGIMDVLEAVAK
ncbi:MAG: NADH-quinone oxidoreductase subunit B family protein [Nitrospirota bacterium]